MPTRSLVSAFLSGLVLSAAPMASGESVDFEELPAMNDPFSALSDEYADMGLVFQVSGSTWSGMSQGDPGGWGLEGSNGPAFLGISGPSYNLAMSFDQPVAAFGFDVARAGGVLAAEVRVLGFRENAFVEEVTLSLPSESNQWQRVELSEDVDMVIARGSGFAPYGVDNLQWLGASAEAEALEVELDIKPGSERNPIRIRKRGRGVIPMVVFGSESFDVLEVDPATLRFGPGLAPPAHGDGHLVDTDGDGFTDLLIHARAKQSGIRAGDSEACLEGMTFDGMPFYGCDRVTPIARGRR